MGENRSPFNGELFIIRIRLSQPGSVDLDTDTLELPCADR